MRAALPMLVAAAVGAGSFLLLTHGGNTVRADFAIVPSLERAAALAGFGLDEVHLTGHAFTADADVYDALDLDNVRSFVALDTAAVRNRIERLPWVATADLRRVFPGRLEVRITERKPFAVWRRGDQETLIDRAGRVLAKVNSGSLGDLPRVAGEGANTQVSALLGLLDQFPGIKSRLEAAEWVGERRWTLFLAGNVTLHLPAGRAAPAIDGIGSVGGIDALIAPPGRIIDLRAQGRIAIREGGGARLSTRAAEPGAGFASGSLSGSGT